MRYRYKILATAIAILVLLAFTGCNNLGDSESADAGTTQSNDTTEETASAVTEPPEVSTATDETGFDVGDVLPDFSVPTADGGMFMLSENLGKPVFINLFTTWCGPCVGEMPEIDELYKEMGKDVAFIVIDIGENLQTVKSFAADNGYSLPFAYTEDGAPFRLGLLRRIYPANFRLELGRYDREVLRSFVGLRKL